MTDIVYHKNYSLKKFNTWNLIGAAEYCVMPKSVSELMHVLEKNKSAKLSLTCLGLGSNVLIRDGGIAGIVCITFPGLSWIKLSTKNLIEVGAGTPCAQVARFCTKHQLTGLEFFSGIPGTVGGALYMNAGAFGSETWEFVKQVNLFNSTGQIIQKNADFFDVGYRYVNGLKKNEYFLSAYFELRPDTTKSHNQPIKSLLKKRNEQQPIGLASCGSVFKNTEDYKAAKLIDEAGLKNYRVGKAYVSCKHANFIITEKGAKSEHVELVMKHVSETVENKYGILLKPEVKILGKNK